MYADENVIKIKHAVFLEVAKAAFAGNLDEIRDDIPFTLIPGPTPQFRCCIYKEREIIRQRVRLAEGKAPSANDDGNIIQVISSACEDCPISSYTVTENCQNCLGKACINACIGCGKCANVCPKQAIEMTSEFKNLKEVLPPIIEKGVDCIEFHALGEDENEVDEKWNDINDLYDGPLSICIDRSKLGNERVLKRINRMLEK